MCKQIYLLLQKYEISHASQRLSLSQESAILLRTRNIRVTYRAYYSNPKYKKYSQ